MGEADYTRMSLTSQEVSEFRDGKPGILNDSAHGVGIHGVITRDGQEARSIRHHDMLALPQDPESGALERSDCVQMIDARYLRHRSYATSTSRTSTPVSSPLRASR